MEENDSGKKRLPSRDLGMGKLAHYYALMVFHNYTEEQAQDLVYNKTYDELNKITHIEYFLNLAKQGFEKFFFIDGSRMEDFDELIHEENSGDYTNYLLGISRDIEKLFNNNYMEIYDHFMKMLEFMNNTRIVENVPDDFYDEPTEYHKVLRNLPLELAGVDEVRNYMTIVNGIMSKFYFMYLGEIWSVKKDDKLYNQFELCKDAEMFYSVSILNFLESRNIRNRNDLRNYLKHIGDDFDPLKPENAPKGKKELAEKRLKQMTDDKFVDKLTDYLLQTNTYIEEVFEELKEHEDYKGISR